MNENDTRRVKVLQTYILRDDPIRYEIIVQGKGGKFLLGLVNIQEDSIHLYGPLEDEDVWGDNDGGSKYRKQINRLEFLLGVGTTPERAALHVIDVWNSILGERPNE